MYQQYGITVHYLMVALQHYEILKDDEEVIAFSDKMLKE